VDWPLTLGSHDLHAYEGPLRYAGAVVGPVANRISGASARIGDTQFSFDANENGMTTLHGGAAGLHARVWSVVEAELDLVVMELALPSGDGGFPGTRRFRAEYRIEPPASLKVTLSATTDAPTLINLANHSYWNLDGTPTTAGHRLTVAADRYTPVDAAGIPTGEVAPVAGTPFDLRRGVTLDDRPLYDHNLCLAEAPRPLSRAARLQGRSGVTLDLETTEPGLQVYDGRFLDTAPDFGLTGRPYGAFAGVALEAQRWPDAPNRPGFPSLLLRPGETSVQVTRFTFARA
jgi:aldose 1-epimerase